MAVLSCTIDSSCVIALDHLGLMPQLSLLFSRVLLPKAVREELFKRRATKDRLQSLLESYAFVRRCDDYDRAAVSVLLIERGSRGLEDRGEAEAIVQAAGAGAMVIVDEPWGRELAGRYSLDYHGTLWILKRLLDLGILSAADLRANVIALLNRGIRLPQRAVDTLLMESERCR